MHSLIAWHASRGCVSALHPCGVAEASHQPPRGSLVLVAPAENATDESDDDCYNKVHWLVSTFFLLRVRRYHSPLKGATCLWSCIQDSQ